MILCQWLQTSDKLDMLLALYFHSRKNFNDRSTWGKEQLPQDYSCQEVAQAAKLAGCEGYAIIDNEASPRNQVIDFKWFI